MNVILRVVLVILLTFPASLAPPQPQRSMDASFSRLLSGDPPVAVANSYSTDEDVLLEVAAPGVLGNDTDPETDPLTAVLISDVSHGVLILDSDGALTYLPNENYAGSDSFTYAADDGTSQSNTVTVTITIHPINDPPTGVDDWYELDEDTVLNVNPALGVLSNDTDPDSGSLTAVLVEDVASGQLTLNPNGSFVYDPDPDFEGADSFTYQASDGTLLSGVVTVDLMVNAVNDAPTATAETYTTAEDTPLTVTAPGVLANDNDIDGDTLSAVLAAGPTRGSLTLNADGSFVYTPNANINGSDSFTYRASDGQAVSTPATTVTINITAVNDRPVAVNDSGYSVTEDSSLSVPAATGVLANDTDVENDPLTAVLATGTANGTLTLNANGSFLYTPTANFHGTDSFTYRANDGALDSANAASVTISVISVNDLPVAVDDAYTTPEDTTLSVPAPGVLGNDQDVDVDPLTAELVLGPTHGILALNPNGSFSYTPNADFHGNDTFTYRANDGTGVSVLAATVTITVEPRNDAPVANADAYTTAEDTPLTVAAPGVLANDTDIDADSLTAVIATQPQHGTLTLNANGSFTYTPALNYNGPDSFTYYANDGTVNSNAAATVTITVTEVNDLPVAVADAYTTAEDTPLTVAAPGVLANDTDAEHDPLTAVVVAGPAHGSLTLNADGSFTYTPALNYNGADSFTYRANDGSSLSELAATVSITITPDNDLPVAVNDSYTTNEDTPLTVAAPGVLGNDTDEEGDTLTAHLATPPSHGALTLNANGGFTYTPALNYFGSDSFTYTASDAEGPSQPATVTITVISVNDAPVANPDTYPAIDEDTVLSVPSETGVLANDTDVENDALTARLVSQPAHGTVTLNPNGSFTYAPALNYNGPDSFVYTAFDGALDSEETTVSLTVTPVNDPPVANTASVTTPEDTPLAITLTATDVETPAALTFAIITPPTHGALTGTAPNLTYTPELNYYGADSFTFQVTDPGALASNIATISITITPVNDAPSAVNDAYETAEDTPLTVVVPGVLTNDSDIEQSPLTAVISTSPGHGTMALNANGSFTYTPALNYNGTDTFTYFANDGSLNSTTAATVTITITPVNDPPVGVSDSYTTAEDTPITPAILPARGVLANDSDVDGDELTATIAGGAAHGTVTLQPNGLFTYTPQLNYFGPDSFTYRVSDGTVSIGPIIVNLTITPVNDAPVTFSKYYQVSVGGELVVPAIAEESGLLEDAMDVENDAFIAEVVNQPAHGSVTVNPDGSFTYFTQLGSTEDDNFTFRACEVVSHLCSAPSIVTIDLVNAVDDIQINFVSPVTNNRRWRMGTENITLKVDITNCEDCGVRYYRWDAVSQHYDELATVHGDTTYTFSSTILNAGWDFSGWNQVMAIAVLPQGGLASNRQYIWLIRLPYDGPATRVYFPLGAGK